MYVVRSSRCFFTRSKNATSSTDAMCGMGTMPPPITCGGGYACIPYTGGMYPASAGGSVSAYGGIPSAYGGMVPPIISACGGSGCIPYGSPPPGGTMPSPLPCLLRLLRPGAPLDMLPLASIGTPPSVPEALRFLRPEAPGGTPPPAPTCGRRAPGAPPSYMGPGTSGAAPRCQLPLPPPTPPPPMPMVTCPSMPNRPSDEGMAPGAVVSGRNCLNSSSRSFSWSNRTVTCAYTSWMGRCSFWYVCRISRNCLYVSGSPENRCLILFT